jgi:hypothetical protein
MVKPAKGYGTSDEDGMGSIVVVDFSRPADCSTAHDASLPVAMQRCDSKMGDEHVTDDFDARYWQWSVGQRRRCRDKTCR